MKVLAAGLVLVAKVFGICSRLVPTGIKDQGWG